jgi:exosortase A
MMVESTRDLASGPRGASAPPRFHAISAEWRKTALLIAIGTVAIIAIYWPICVAAVTVWSVSPSYMHCFLIPLIVAYLLWEKRSVFVETVPQPTALPLVAILGLSIMALFGNAMSVLEVQQFALVTMIQALVLALVGWRVFLKILFPMIYLFFLVPTGEFLVPKLQDFTAAFVVTGLQIVGIPVLSDGVFIRIPNQLFEVAEACAGLRFLIANVAFGSLFAYLMYSSWRKRTIFIVLSFIVPIIANGFRAFGIVLIAYFSDGKLAAGVDHIVYGWGFFVAIMFGMMWVGLKFRDSEEAQPLHAMSREATPPWTVTAAVIVGLGAILVSAAGPAYAYWLEYRNPPHPVSLPVLAIDGGWRPTTAPGDGWRPTFGGTDGELSQTYVGPQGEAHLYIAYFTTQRHGGKIISSQNRIEDEDRWKRVSTGSAMATVDGQPMAVSKQILTAGNDRRIAWYFYWVDQHLTASALGAKLLGARGTLLTGHPQAAAIVIAADVHGTELEAEARIQDLLRHADFSAYLSQAAKR